MFLFSLLYKSYSTIYSLKFVYSLIEKNPTEMKVQSEMNLVYVSLNKNNKVEKKWKDESSVSYQIQSAAVFQCSQHSPNSQLSYYKHAHLLLRMDPTMCSSHSWSCQASEVMFAWHDVIDWTGLELHAAATKAHSSRDNGELTAWVVFITLLSLSVSLPPPVYCVCCLTASLLSSQSLTAQAHVRQAVYRLKRNPLRSVA